MLLCFAYQLGSNGKFHSKTSVNVLKIATFLTAFIMHKIIVYQCNDYTTMPLTYDLYYLYIYG